MKFNKVIIVGGVAILLAGGLSIWQNSRPIQQAVQLKDLGIRRTALRISGVRSSAMANARSRPDLSSNAFQTPRP